MPFLSQLKLFFLILFLTSCQWFRPTAYFFISNISEDNKSVDIKVTVDGKVVFNDTINHTNIQPDLQYTPYISLPKGEYTIKIVADSGRAIAEQLISFESDRWIFVSYHNAKPIDSLEAKILLKNFGNNTSFVNPKLRGLPPSIRIHIMDKEPVHM